jgi:hypothetical protein
MRTRTFVLSSIFLLASFNARGDDSWIADANGCKVWNPRPVPGETVSWSGACKDGYADGPGVMQWMREGTPLHRVEGAFTSGKPNGKMISVSPNGDRYEGDYLDGKRTGVGVITNAKGDRYEGAFVDGKREGAGELSLATGEHYKGNFSDGKPDGYGEMTWADGSTYKGQFVDGKPAEPEKIARKNYSIRESVIGSYIERDVVTGIQVPVDKTYAELTVGQKLRIKSLYEPMGENDEPPYPLDGLKRIMDAAAELGKKLDVRGLLSMAVTVNGEGHAMSVDVFKSPDPKLTKNMALVLMLEKYKPAVCKGMPCTMQFPFQMNYIFKP